jgi:hypothetical protein
MVEEPTQDLDVPFEAIREEEQKDSEKKKIMTTTMIMKMKRSNEP